MDWYVTYEGQVSGRVRDAEGQPVADLRMTLERKDAPLPGYERSAYATTGLDGTYHFDHLSPGRYLLYTRGSLSLTGDSLLYFPHATNVDQAQLIDVGDSTSVGGYDFTLSKLKPTMPVRVTVLEPDGSPAQAGLLLFAFPNGTSGNEPTRTAITDTLGVATLPLHSGQEYAISIALDSHHQNCGFATKTFFGTETSTTLSITSPEKCPR